MLDCGKPTSFTQKNLLFKNFIVNFILVCSLCISVYDLAINVLFVAVTYIFTNLSRIFRFIIFARRKMSKKILGFCFS